MTASKIIKCMAHFSCALTYLCFFFGIHAEVMYLGPGIAYSVLIVADFAK